MKKGGGEEITFKDLALSDQKLLPLTSALEAHFIGKQISAYISLESILYSDLRPPFTFSASGYNLQGLQKASFITGSLIKGAPFTLEDGKTQVSQEEALAYALATRFSPLNNGFRFNPY